MDRVVLGGCFLLVALGVLVGLGISAEQSIGKSIRDAMELLSFAGTAITGVVAVLAFNNWQTQFRHTERFKALKELKDSSLDLYSFLNYLNSMVARDMESITHGSQVDERALEESVARQQWLASLDVYRKAWGVAVVFLTPEEVNGFCGPVKIFSDRTFEYLLKIRTSYTNCHTDERLNRLLSTAAEVTESARALCDQTIKDVEQMLARHAVA